MEGGGLSPCKGLTPTMDAEIWEHLMDMGIWNTNQSRNKILGKQPVPACQLKTTQVGHLELVWN